MTEPSRAIVKLRYPNSLVDDYGFAPMLTNTTTRSCSKTSVQRSASAVVAASATCLCTEGKQEMTRLTLTLQRRPN